MNPYLLTSSGGSKGGNTPPWMPHERMNEAGSHAVEASVDIVNNDPRGGHSDRARTTGEAREAHCRFILWLVPTVERFPRDRKFLLGDLIQTTALDVLERLIEATYTRRRSGHLAGATWVWRSCVFCSIWHTICA